MEESSRGLLGHSSWWVVVCFHISLSHTHIHTFLSLEVHPSNGSDIETNHKRGAVVVSIHPWCSRFVSALRWRGNGSTVVVLWILIPSKTSCLTTHVEVANASCQNKPPVFSNQQMKVRCQIRNVGTSSSGMSRIQSTIDLWNFKKERKNCCVMIVSREILCVSTSGFGE